MKPTTDSICRLTDDENLTPVQRFLTFLYHIFTVLSSLSSMIPTQSTLEISMELSILNAAGHGYLLEYCV
jgi:hypothetical protein